MPAQVRGKVPVTEMEHCPGAYGRGPGWPGPGDAPAVAGGRHVADAAAWAAGAIEAGADAQEWPGRLHDVALAWRVETMRAAKWAAKQAEGKAGTERALDEARRRAGAPPRAPAALRR